VRISVVGIGHVGLVTAACMARWGHDVVGMDDDAAKVATLQDGGVPFHEPDLPELLAEVTDAGRLRYTTDVAEAVAHAEIVFVCVGTPSLPGGGPNLSYVERVGRDVAEHATHDVVLVEKSTVPANTGARLSQVIEREDVAARGVTVHVASNPEFLREGVAVQDTLHPDRVVYGTSSDFARDRLREAYATLVEQDGTPVVETNVPTAELIKHASNAFLATKISFINQVARICERVGADVDEVADGMGLDERIGRQFLNAGIGYGGSCFPKDVDAFIHLARQVGEDFKILEHVREVNVSQRTRVLDALRDELWHLDEKVVAVLGAAFKPGTDDLREAPGIHLAKMLAAEGAHVRIWDPVALDAVEREEPWLTRVEQLDDAVAGAHAVVVATEWPQVAALDPAQLKAAMAYPIVVDGRNCMDGAAMVDAGIHYRGIGKPLDVG